MKPESFGLGLRSAAPGFAFGEIDLEVRVAGPSAAIVAAAPILQDFQVVAASGRAVAAATGIGRIAKLQIAAANRGGQGQTSAFVRFEIEAGTGQFVDGQAAEAGDLRQRRFVGVNIGDAVRRKFHVARHAMLVPPLRRFRNFVEDVGVFGEHGGARNSTLIRAANRPCRRRPAFGCHPEERFGRRRISIVLPRRGQFDIDAFDRQAGRRVAG